MKTNSAPVVTRAIPTPPEHRASSSLYLSEARGSNFATSRRMVNVGVEPASASVAARLQVEEDAPVFARRKLMFADDIPIRVATSFFPVELASGTSLEDDDFVTEGLQVILEGLGLRFGHAHETLIARTASPKEAEPLGLPGLDSTIVEILRSSYDVNDRPVHTLETICVADRHVFAVQQLEGDYVF